MNLAEAGDTPPLPPGVSGPSVDSWRDAIEGSSERFTDGPARA
jgi:hypothetical protein